MWYGFGNRAQTSTQAAATNPSTTTILAEITDLTNDRYEARVLLGASTYATFLVEQATSSVLTAIREGGAALGRRTIYGSINQTGQYMLRFTAESGDRLRVRLAGAIAAGEASATIQLERMD